MPVSAAKLAARTAAPSLSDRFLVPPWSVLSARDGYWQDRKRQWIAMGIQSEIGRDAPSYKAQKELNDILAQKRSKNSDADYAFSTGTSIFDPVLCELVYRWFSDVGQWVLDPFAGGSVRGIVATTLGRHYTGIDLSYKQCEANATQAYAIKPEIPPMWYHGDAMAFLCIIEPDVKYDLIFTCPPYGDLEQYSDDPADLSNMSFDEFVQAYRIIIGLALSRLANNRFAVFVVGDYRSKDGYYRNLSGITVQAFEDAGAKLYNEAILVTSPGSLPIRTGRMFTSGRKLGRTHQTMLVFCKGDWQLAAKACGVADFDVQQQKGLDIFAGAAILDTQAEVATSS